VVWHHPSYFDQGQMIMLVSPRSVLATVASLGAVLALGISGCGGASRPTVSSERPEIGYVVSNSDYFAKDMSEGFRAGAQIAGGVETKVVGPRTTDPPKQVDLFKELTTTAKGGIAVSATSRALLARPLAEAAAEGIPLAVSAGQPPPGSGVKLLIENDNYELGRMLADEAIKRLPPEAMGKIVLGSDRPAHPALEQRARGMREVFATRLPGVRVVGPFDTQQDQRTNLAAWRLLVDANPDAVAFLGTGDVDAFNLPDVRAGSKGTWLSGGFSIEPHVLQGVKNGHMFAVISPEHFLKGATTGWLLAQRAKGVRALPEGWLATPGLPVTADNVDEIIQRQSAEAAKLSWTKPQLDRITADTAGILRPLEHAR
jgi:ribose transport system substrate-binding protein